MAISDRILLLNEGKFERQGPQSMDATPDTLFTAEFIGDGAYWQHLPAGKRWPFRATRRLRT